MKKMKRVITLLLLAVLLLGVFLLAGCRSQKLTVDPDNGTISDGKYTYTYTDETTSKDGTVRRVIRIKYPNGSYYLWEQYRGYDYFNSGGQGLGAYDVTVYTRGEDLVNAIRELDQEQVTEPTGVYIEQIGDQKFEIDTDNQTITTNGHVFPYEFDGHTVSITYPNGSTLIYCKGDVSWGNADEDTVENNGEPYANYEDLISVVPWPEPLQIKSVKTTFVFNIRWPRIIMGLILIAVGVWMVHKPAAFWQYRFGRWYKNAEPSDLAIKGFVAGGYFDIILGMIVVLTGIFTS